MAQVTDKQWLEGVQTAMIKELTTHKAALPEDLAENGLC